MITKEEFLQIFESEHTCWEGDNAFQGLEIIARYTNNILTGASHDIIFSENITTLIDSGITRHDVESLKNLNWMIEDETYLACFV